MDIAAEPRRTAPFLRAIICGRERRVLVLLLGIIALSVADLVVTITHLKTIGMIEANPIAAYLIRSTHSTWILAAYKLLTVGISVTLLFVVRRHRIGEIASWSSMAILVAMSVSWHSYAEYVDDPEHVRIAQSGAYGDEWLLLE